MNFLKSELWGWLSMQCLNARNRIFCSYGGLPTAHCFRGGIFFHTTLTAGLRRQHSRSEVNATPLKAKKKKKGPDSKKLLLVWWYAISVCIFHSLLEQGWYTVHPKCWAAESRRVTPHISGTKRLSPAKVPQDKPLAAPANMPRASSTFKGCARTPRNRYWTAWQS